MCCGNNRNLKELFEFVDNELQKAKHKKHKCEKSESSMLYNYWKGYINSLEKVEEKIINTAKKEKEKINTTHA